MCSLMKYCVFLSLVLLAIQIRAEDGETESSELNSLLGDKSAESFDSNIIAAPEEGHAEETEEVNVENETEEMEAETIEEEEEQEEGEREEVEEEGDGDEAKLGEGDEEGDEVKGEGDEVKGEGDEAKGEGDEAKGEGDEAKGEGDEAKGEEDEAKGEGDEAKGEGDEAIDEGEEDKEEQVSPADTVTPGLNNDKKDNDKKDKKDKNIEDQRSKSCICKNRVNQALIKALQSCTEVLTAIQKCKSPSNKPIKNTMITSCKCSDKVTAALVKSLKSCTNAVDKSAGCTPGGGRRIRAQSCKEIKRKNPRSRSGYYKLYINRRVVRVYCFMGKFFGQTGWTRLTYFNARTSRCPSTLMTLRTRSIRHCARPTSKRASCASVKISSRGIKYSRIFGRVRGYQYYTTDGARGYYQGKGSINKAYVDGVIVTRGRIRKHVWTFISALTASGRADCPCIRGADKGAYPPRFVGNNYFCESGFKKGYARKWAITDPLWDGKMCVNKEVACCRRAGLPYFYRYVGSTRDNIEMRVCCDESTAKENVSIDRFTFYVR